MRRHGRDPHDALRVLRSAPKHTVAAAAAAVGLPPDTLADRLTRTHPRSGCGAAIAATAAALVPRSVQHHADGTSTVGALATLLTHPACPPTVLRLAAASPAETGWLPAGFAGGTGSWAARPARRRPMTVSGPPARPVDRHGLRVGPSCPPALQTALAAHAGDKAAETAADRCDDPTSLLVLCVSPDGRTRRRLAANPAAPPLALAVLATDDDSFDIVFRALIHPRCPPAALATAAVHRSEGVRAAAASNANCDPDVLHRLASDPSTMVRRATFANPSATPTPDPDDETAAEGLAANPATSTAQLRVLAHRWGAETRAAAAANPNCGPGLLDELADTEPSVTLAAAANPNCGRHALERVYRTGSALRRAAAAANPACPPDLLAGLAADRRNDVRAAVAANPSVDTDTLTALTRDHGDIVASRAATNPACSPTHIQILRNRSGIQARLAVAANPACTAVDLAALSVDTQPRVASRARQRLIPA